MKEVEREEEMEAKGKHKRMKNNGTGTTLTEMLSFCFQKREWPFHQLSADSACASTLAVFKQIFKKLSQIISQSYWHLQFCRCQFLWQLFSQREIQLDDRVSSSVLHQRDAPPVIYTSIFLSGQRRAEKKLSSEQLGEHGKSHIFRIFSTMQYIWFYGFTWQKENHSILNQPSASDWAQVFFFRKLKRNSAGKFTVRRCKMYNSEKSSKERQYRLNHSLICGLKFKKKKNPTDWTQFFLVSGLR